MGIVGVKSQKDISDNPVIGINFIDVMRRETNHMNSPRSHR